MEAVSGTETETAIPSEGPGAVMFTVPVAPVGVRDLF